MSAFDKAWALLKAIPSQQELLDDYESTEHLPIYDDEKYGVRFRSFGTVHPQARSMALRALDQGKTRVYPLLEREPRQGDKGAASEEARKDEVRPYSMLMQGIHPDVPE